MYNCDLARISDNKVLNQSTDSNNNGKNREKFA